MDEGNGGRKQVHPRGNTLSKAGVITPSDAVDQINVFLKYNQAPNQWTWKNAAAIWLRDEGSRRNAYVRRKRRNPGDLNELNYYDGYNDPNLAVARHIYEGLQDDLLQQVLLVGNDNDENAAYKDAAFLAAGELVRLRDIAMWGDDNQYIRRKAPTATTLNVPQAIINKLIRGIPGALQIRKQRDELLQRSYELWSAQTDREGQEEGQEASQQLESGTNQTYLDYQHELQRNNELWMAQEGQEEDQEASQQLESGTDERYLEYQRELLEAQRVSELHGSPGDLPVQGGNPSNQTFLQLSRADDHLIENRHQQEHAATLAPTPKGVYSIQSAREWMKSDRVLHESRTNSNVPEWNQKVSDYMNERSFEKQQIVIKLLNLIDGPNPLLTVEEGIKTLEDIAQLSPSEQTMEGYFRNYIRQDKAKTDSNANILLQYLATKLLEEQSTDLIQPRDKQKRVLLYTLAYSKTSAETATKLAKDADAEVERAQTRYDEASEDNREALNTELEEAKEDRDELKKRWGVDANPLGMEIAPMLIANDILTIKQLREYVLDNNLGTLTAEKRDELVRFYQQKEKDITETAKSFAEDYREFEPYQPYAPHATDWETLCGSSLNMHEASSFTALNDSLKVADRGVKWAKKQAQDELPMEDPADWNKFYAHRVLRQISHQQIKEAADRHKKARKMYTEMKNRGKPLPEALRDQGDWWNAFRKVVNDEGALSKFIEKCKTLLEDHDDWDDGDSHDGRNVRPRRSSSTANMHASASLVARLDRLAVVGLRRESTKHM